MRVHLQFALLCLSFQSLPIYGWTAICEYRSDPVHDGIFVNCSHQALNTVPAHFPYNTTSIDLSNNLISIVNNNSFQFVKRLKELVLSYNHIARLETLAFNGCAELQYLDLSFNKLTLTQTSYPNGVFSALVNLKVLNMQNNPLGDVGIYPDIFQNLTKLKTLRIDSFANPRFSEGMKNLVSLKQLFFANDFCNLDTLRNDTFLVFKNLSIEELDLEHCNIVSVETGVFEPFRKLKKLSLADTTVGIKNALKMLAPFYGREMKALDLSLVRYTGHVTPLIRLKDAMLTAADMKPLADICVQRVNLRYNYILHYNSIGLLNTLFSRCVSHLNLSKNNLKFDYNSLLLLEQLSNLKHLDISNQKGAVIPQDHYTKTVDDLSSKSTGMTEGIVIPFPKSLEHLNASLVSGSFGGIPSNVTFLNGQSLRIFDVSFLGLSDINGYISGFEDLLVLKLSGNPNLKVPETFFETMPSLERLDLSDHTFKQVTLLRQGQRLLQPLINLKYLKLRNNHLSQLPSGLFKSNCKLKHLDLSDNAFTSVPYDLRQLFNLEVLDLSSNTIRNLVESTRDEIEELVADSRNAMFSLLLGGNLFSCSCANLEFFRWIREKNPRVHLDHHGNYSCLLEQGLESNTGYQVKELTQMWRKCTGVQLFYISFSSFVIFIAMLLSLLLVKVNKTVLNHMIMNIFRQEIPKPKRADFRRDVYISYAEDDYQWVCHHLCPALERRRLSLFIWDRDSVPGDSIPDQIVENVHSCWKVLLYYTDNFHQDPWTYMRVMAAINSVDDNSPEKVLLLLPEDENPRLPNCLLEVIPESCIVRVPDGSCYQGSEDLWDTISNKVKED